MADLDLVAPVSAIGKLPSGVFDYAILLLMLFYFYFYFFFLALQNSVKASARRIEQFTLRT